MLNKIEKIVVTIPARLESSRLPNKVMAEIGKKTMIERVLFSCSKAKNIDEIFLCTDNNEIYNHTRSLGYKALKTIKNLSSGTERISSVLRDIALQFYPIEKDCSEEILIKLLSKIAIINVQGDQPFLDPDVITSMVQIFKNSAFPPELITPIYKLSKESIHNPNVVKTLINGNKKAIYFSRAAIPFVRDFEKDDWHLKNIFWGHVGIYGYRGDILKKWNTLNSSYLEKLEKLEQLRFIEAGYLFDTFEVQGDFLSVDTLDQLQKAREIAEKLDT